MRLAHVAPQLTRQPIRSKSTPHRKVLDVTEGPRETSARSPRAMGHGITGPP